MASKSDENYIAFCNDLRAYVQEHHLFPAKHSTALNKIKYISR